MRMRNLGSGQSVVFCVPNDVQQRIRESQKKGKGSVIGVSDVLRWAISETWTNIRRSIPLWAIQGKRYERQRQIWQRYCPEDSVDMTSMEAQQFQEPECQTLEQRYRPACQMSSEFDSLPHKTQALISIAERCEEFDSLDSTSTTLQEEQERELAPEIVSEQQVERPPTVTPEKHRIHPDLLSFIKTGVLESSTEAYKPAFETLLHTSAACALELSQFPPILLATTDFATTIRPPPGSHFLADAFQRPVRWVLVSACSAMPGGPKLKHMVVISPYEANHLMSEIRVSRRVSLHLYAPRQNFGFPSFDKLALHITPEISGMPAIPDSFRIQLNLFSGQLYLDSYSGYKRLCEFLGIAYAKTPENLVVAADGFIQQNNEGTMKTFRQSPLKFLHILMSQIRKDGQKIGRTHIGQIIEGKLLSPRDFLGPVENH